MPLESLTYRDFKLSSGIKLPEVKIAYRTYGKLNSDKSNVIWICHALTADPNVDEWWPDMFGSGKVFDPEKYFIVCPNFLGSCYGSTGASSPEVPIELRRKNFPLINIQDMVNAHVEIAKQLNIDRISLLIGSSLGGQQALHWAVHFPKQIEKLCLIATNAFHSPWGIAFNESQRMAIEADKTFSQNKENGGKLGLKAARSIALLSYRTSEIYNQSQNDSSDKQSDFAAASYQKYQGEKLVKRFCPFAYYAITRSMDSHNIGRSFDSVEQALNQVVARTLCIGITSDILFTPNEQKFMAKNIKTAEYIEIDSIYGHDGFLVEGDTLNNVILEWATPNRLTKIA
jgi:homoserine O-acetyltransferase